MRDRPFDTRNAWSVSRSLAFASSGVKRFTINEREKGKGKARGRSKQPSRHKQQTESSSKLWGRTITNGAISAALSKAPQLSRCCHARRDRIRFRSPSISTVWCRSITRRSAGKKQHMYYYMNADSKWRQNLLVVRCHPGSHSTALFIDQTLSNSTCKGRNNTSYHMHYVMPR